MRNNTSITDAENYTGTIRQNFKRNMSILLIRNVSALTLHTIQMENDNIAKSQFAAELKLRYV